MTPQEVFDKVADHLARQKIQAIDANGLCMLKNAKGQMCAVGCLIPKEEYNFEMEEHSGLSFCAVGDISNIFSRWINDNYRDHIPLLSELQEVHDQTVCISGTYNWGYTLQVLSKIHNLTFDKVKFEDNLADSHYCY